MPPPRSATRPWSPHSAPLFWPLPLSRLLLHAGTQPMHLYRLLPLPCTSFISFGDTWHASRGEVGWQRVQTKEDLHEATPLPYFTTKLLHLSSQSPGKGRTSNASSGLCRWTPRRRASSRRWRWMGMNLGRRGRRGQEDEAIGLNTKNQVPSLTHLLMKLFQQLRKNMVSASLVHISFQRKLIQKHRDDDKIGSRSCLCHWRLWVFIETSLHLCLVWPIYYSEPHHVCPYCKACFCIRNVVTDRHIWDSRQKRVCAQLNQCQTIYTQTT